MRLPVLFHNHAQQHVAARGAKSDVWCQCASCATVIVASASRGGRAVELDANGAVDRIAWSLVARCGGPLCEERRLVSVCKLRNRDSRKCGSRWSDRGT